MSTFNTDARGLADLTPPDMGAQKWFLRDSAHQTLRAWILNQNLKWAQELSENELASRLGISRTPVREALRLLEAEGLVVRAPSGGMRVREFTTVDIAQMYEVLIPLYRLTAVLAAERWDPSNEVTFEYLLEAARRAEGRPDVLRPLHDEFHELIGRTSGNPWLVKSLRSLRTYTGAFRVTLMRSEQRWRAGEAEHQQIYELLRSRQATEAGEAMDQHIRNARDALLGMLGPDSSAEST
jgi:DNA-binding GntR family transcriptional regulator